MVARGSDFEQYGNMMIAFWYLLHILGINFRVGLDNK